MTSVILIFVALVCSLMECELESAKVIPYYEQGCKE